MMGFAGLIASSWLLCLHIVFHGLAKNDYHLIRRWMAMTYELPVKSEKEYRIAGLSRKRTKQFFREEDEFLARFYRFMNISLFASYAVFPVQLFFVNYDADLLSYIVAQTINVIHISWFIWLYLAGVYMINTFYCKIIQFFSKRFQYLSKQLRILDAANNKLVDNRRLARLVFEHNRVLFDLMEMNDLFKVGLYMF